MQLGNDELETQTGGKDADQSTVDRLQADAYGDLRFPPRTLQTSGDVHPLFPLYEFDDDVSERSNENTAKNENDAKPAGGNEDNYEVTAGDDEPSDEELPEPEAEREAKADREVKDDPLKDLPRLKDQELSRTRFLQEALSKHVALYLGTETQKTRDAIKKESDAGVFGPATKEAYKQYVSWLEKAVPETVRQMESLHRALPPGGPLQLPVDRFDHAVSPQYYTTLVAEKKLTLDLKIDCESLPSHDTVEKLLDTFAWLEDCNRSAESARSEQMALGLQRTIDEQGLPKEWNRKPGENLESWNASAGEMVDLAVRVRNYVEAMRSLYMSSGGKFPFELPPGTSLTLVDAANESRKFTVTDKTADLNGFLLKNDAKKLTVVQLDLPQDLRQDHPANAQKIQQLREWLTKYGDKIDQAAGELVKLQENPDAVIMYGDQEVSNGKGVFDKDGHFVRLVDDRYVTKPGETVRQLNMLGYDFQSEKITEGPLAGKYKITQTIQAESAPWYAYQNIRAFGIEKVGKPMSVDDRLPFDQAAARYKITEEQLKEVIAKGQLQTERGEDGKIVVVCPKIVGGDDFVPVRDGGKVEIMKASQLDSFRTMTKAWYVGEKALNITMDVAMLVSGTIEVGAAIRGARLAVVGAEAALKLSGKQVAWEIIKGGVRIGMAGAGILNNAGGRDSEFGRTVNNVRGIYFLGDIGLGLANSARSMMSGVKAAEALSSAEKVHTIIQGRKAAEGVEALKGIPWVRQAYKGAEWSFKATEVGFAPVLIKDLNAQIREIRESGKRDANNDAVQQIGDGRGMQLAGRGAFDPKNAEALKGTLATLDGFSATLTAGRSEEVQKEIRKILDETKTLLNATEEKKAEQRKKLVALITFTPEQIKQLEDAHPSANAKDTAQDFHLSPQDLHRLLDPEARKVLPMEVRVLAEKFLAQQNKDVLAAARISLLYLSRDKDGKLSPEQISSDSTVPAHVRTVVSIDFEDGSSGHREETTHEFTIAEHTAKQSLSISEIVRDLQRDLASPQEGNRGIVTGEVLTRLGAITHQQYGGILQDVLLNPNSKPEDKMRALVDANGPRMAAIIDGLIHQESAKGESSPMERHRELGRHHGLTAEDLLKTLEKTSKEDKAPEVRAMAAALLYGLKENNNQRRAELLNGFNTMYAASKDNFVAEVTKFLKKEMNTDIPPDPLLGDRVRESRLNAAMSLALITGNEKGDQEAQKEITRSIAKSFSATDSALSARVLEALLPDRFAQLAKEDKALADELRKAAVKLLQKPDEADSAARQKEWDLVQLLRHMDPLFKDADPKQRRAVVDRIHEMLRNSDFNKNYARHYPDLRIAAIETLVKDSFFSHQSLQIVLSHAADGRTVKIGKEEVDCTEPDGRVRAAAAKALASFRDGRMAGAVNDMIDHERDAAVAARLGELRFSIDHKEPEPRQYQKKYEEARIRLRELSEVHPELKGFKDSAVREWLQSNFALLDADVYQEKVRSAIKGAASWIDGKWTGIIKEQEAMGKIADARQKLWTDLCAMARKGDENGNKAKAALYYIMTNNGGPMGEGGKREIQSDHDSSYYHRVPLSMIDWNLVAARELSKLAAENPEGKDIVAHYIKRGLTEAGPLPGPVSLQLLTGLRALGKKDDHGHVIGREELAKITAQALNLEIGRQENQNEQYQIALLEDLRQYRYRMIFPELEAVRDKGKFPRVGKECDLTLSQFRDSVKMMWDDTKADTLANAAQRASKIRGLAEEPDAEEAIQQLFNAYKGYTIKDVNDPGLRHLANMLTTKNDRVRLAVCKVLSESQLPNDSAIKCTALQILADLAMTGSKSAHRTEAFEMLKRMSPDQDVVSSSGVFYSFKRNGGDTTCTILKKDAQNELKPVGYIYPNGEGVRFESGPDGETTAIWVCGLKWERSRKEGKLVNEWVNAEKKMTVTGNLKQPPDGRYPVTSYVMYSLGPEELTAWEDMTEAAGVFTVRSKPQPKPVKK